MRLYFFPRSILPCIFTALSCLALAAVAVAERLPIKIYTSADGLGSSASFNLVRDPRGFIWLCSRDGLVRFDGYRFITFRVGDDEADPAVFDMIPDRSGRYWINLNRGADYRLVAREENDLLDALPKDNGAADARIPLPAVAIKDTPVPLFEDSDGQLWTGNNRGLFIMAERDDGTYELQPVELPIPGNPVEGLTSISPGRAAGGDGFWVGTHWGLIRRLRDGRMFHYSIKPQDGRDLVRAFAEDYSGRVWISQPSGLIVLKTVDFAPQEAVVDVKARLTPGKVAEDGTPVLPQTPGEAVEFSFADILRRYSVEAMNSSDFQKPEIYSVVAGRDGKIWAATNHGLLLFDGQRFQHYTTKQGLAANTISSIVEGNEGHIWLASYGGLHRLNPKGLTTYDETDGLELARISSIYENSAGELHVVSGNFNISTLRDNSFVKAHPKLPVNEFGVWQSNAAFLDSRGDWWVNTNQNLYRFSGVRQIEDLDGREPTAVYNETTGLMTGTILRVFEDSGGNLWLSTFVNTARRGLTRIDRATGEVKHFQTQDGLPSAPSATAFAEDRSGTLWFGFNEGGIRRYREGRFEAVDSDTAPKAGLTSMFIDSKNRLWIASSRDGLSRLDDLDSDSPTFHRYTIAEGLASNNVRCITEDLFGNIYVGTVRGVNRLSPDTGRLKYYGTSDGLASDFINVARRDRKGAIWFGTLNGLSKLVPEPDNVETAAPVIISGVSVAGQEYAVSPLGQRKVFLPEQDPGRNNMRIDFLSINTGDNASTAYQYMLEGVDEGWSEPTAEHTVTLANLGSGSHRFLVRSLVGGTVSTAEPAVVQFSVLRPIWQQWWFLLLAATVLAFAGYAFYRYRLAQMIKLERVRTRIASDLHDDIGSSLSQIAILSEIARHKSGDKSATEPLVRIADTSRDLVDSMSDIVWAINPERDRVSDLVQRMRRFAEEMLDAKDIGYRFTVPEPLRDVAVGADLRRETYLIFKECINNLVKYSAATEAWIDIDVKGSEISVTVGDNGRGFDVEEAVNGGANGFGGNGLSNMRRRATNLGGEFSIESKTGAGTIVSLTVPIGK